MDKRIRLVMITVGIVMTLAAMLPAADWNGYRGPDRDGKTDQPITPWSGKNPPVLWKATVGHGYSAIVEFDGRAYTMGNTAGKDTVFCFDAETGKPLANFSYKCRSNFGNYRGPRSTPAVDKDIVLTVSAEGDLYGLDPKTLKPVWQRHAKEFGCKMPKWAFANSALIDGDAAVYDFGKIVKLDKMTGKTIWQSKNYGEAYCSVQIYRMDGQKTYVAFPAFGLIVLDAENGQTLCTFPWKTRYNVNAAMPVLHGEFGFVSSGYNTGCALAKLQKGSAEQIYRNKHISTHFNTCVLKDGYLYGFTGNAGGGGVLTCMNYKTAEVAWRQKGLGTGSVMLAGETLIVLGEKGQLILADASPEGFKPLAEARPLTVRCWTMPVYQNGRLYCRDEQGHIVVINGAPDQQAAATDTRQ